MQKKLTWFAGSTLMFVFLLLGTYDVAGQTTLLSESFDSTTFPNAGWTKTSAGPAWSRVTSGAFPSQSPHAGAAEADFNSFSVSSGTANLITPALNFSTGGNKVVRFWMYRDNGYATTADKIDVYVNTSASTSGATNLGTVNRGTALSPSVAATGWYQYTFSIPPTYSSTTNYIIFQGTTAYGNDIYLDDVLVTNSPVSPAIPPYAYDFTGGANVFPLGTTTSNRCQWLYTPADFSPAIPLSTGITTVYFKPSNAATSTFSNLTLQLANTTLTTLTSGPWNGVTSVYSPSSVSITTVANGWMKLTLATPFTYTGGNLIVDLSQTSYTTGISLNQGTISGTNRRLYGNTSSNSPTANGTLAAFGFDTSNAFFTPPPPTGTNISTVAGNGSFAYSGDGGAAVSASLNSGLGTATDAAGNIYIADYTNNRIRKVTVSTGIITTVAGTGTAGFSGDGGPAVSAGLNYPSGVAVDTAGNIYIADNVNGRIRKVTKSTGIISTVVSGFSPNSVALDKAGNIYAADPINNKVLKYIVATSTLSAVAGNGTAGFSGDGGAATSAMLNYPYDAAVDTGGNLYIADYFNKRIRKVTAATGIISTITGTGVDSSTGDGSAANSAAINQPTSVATDWAGNIFCGSATGFRVRKITVATGIISTIAGIGLQGFSGDGGPAVGARLGTVWGLSLDPSGNLLVSDFGNSRVRRVDSAGTPMPLPPAVPITGTVTVPSTTYPTLASIVTALNINGVGSGGATINCTAFNNETAPSGGYKLGSAILNASTSAANPLVFNGNNITLTGPTGTGSADAIFFIRGTDYVTINNLNLQDISTTTTTTSTPANEYGYVLGKLNNTAPFDGTQHVTINGCTISLNKYSTVSTGIFMGHVTITSTSPGNTGYIPSDANSYNTFTGNAIINTSRGIFMSGVSSANYDLANMAGGTTASSGNTITVGGTTNTAYGVFSQYDSVVSVQNNTFSIATGQNGTWYGYYAGIGKGDMSVVNNSFNINCAIASGSVYAIYNNGSHVDAGITSQTVTSTHTITGNTITGTNTAGTSSSLYCIYENNAYCKNENISNNVIRDISWSPGVGSGSFYGIYPYNTAAPFLTVDNNSLYNINFRSTATGVYGIYSYNASANYGAMSVQHNTLRKFKANTYLYGIYTYGSGTAAPTGFTGQVLTNNYNVVDSVDFSASTATSSTCFGHYVFYGLDNSDVSYNTFSNFKGAPSGTTALYNYFGYGYYGPGSYTVRKNWVDSVKGASLTIYNYMGYYATLSDSNTVSNIATTGTGSINNYIGYSNSGPANTVTNNRINNISVVGTSVNNYFGYSGTAGNIHHNAVTNVTITGSGAYIGYFGYNIAGAKIYNNRVDSIKVATGALYAFYSYTTTTDSVYNNMVSNLAVTGASTAAVIGYYFVGAGTYSIFNNVLSNIEVNSAFANTNAVGINLATSLTDYKVYDNTIRIAPTSTGASSGYGFTGMLYPAGGTLDLRNNIINVNVTPTTGGYVAALRRASGTANVSPTNFLNTSDANILYAPNVANSYLYAEGTTPATLVNTYNLTNDPNFNGPCGLWKAFLGHDTGSFTENNFVAGILPNTFVPTGSSYAEGRAVATGTPAVTTDYSGAARSATADIGALEFNGTAISTAPPVATISGTGTICAGASRLITFSGAANAIVTYKINGGSSQTITLDGTGSASLNATPSANATYTIASVAAPGGCTFPVSGQSAVITVNPLPAVNAISNRAVCDSSIALSVSFSGTIAGTFSWTNNTPAIGLPASGTDSIASFLATGGSTPVTATITVTPTANACTGAPASFTITVNPRPAASMVSGTIDACSGSSADLSFTGTSGATVTFSDGSATGTALLDVNGDGYATVTPAVTTVYTAVSIVSAAPAGCAGSVGGSATVNILPLPTVTGFSGDTIICSGDGTVLTASASAPIATFKWYDAPTGGNLLYTGDTYTIPALTATTGYYVAVTDGGCTSASRGAVAVMVNALPVITAQPATASETVCLNTAITPLTVSATAGSGTIATYDWFSNASTTPEATHSNSSSSDSYSPPSSTAGTLNYYAVVTNSNGCIATSDPSGLITVNALPIVTVSNSGPLTFCQGGSVILTAGGASSYMWSNSSTAGAITLSSSATVTVDGTDGNGCVGISAPVVVIVNPLPIVPLISGNMVVCKNSTTTLSNSYSGGTWSSSTGSVATVGSSTGVVSGQNVGTALITYTVTNGNGCTNATDTSVTVNPVPDVAQPASQVHCAGNTTTAVSFSGSLSGTVFNWNNGAPSIGLTASGSGNIGAFSATNAGPVPVVASVAVTPAYTTNGLTCYGAQKTFSYTVNPVPAATATPASQNRCTAVPIVPIVLTSTASGTNYTWTRNNTGTVSGMGASGSGSPISGSVTGSGTPTVTFTITPSFTNAGKSCTGASILATVTVVPNTLSATSSVSPVYPLPGQKIQTIFLNYPASKQYDSVRMTPAGGTVPYTYSFTMSGCNNTIAGASFPSPGPYYTFAPTAANICSGTGDNIFTFVPTVTDINGCKANAPAKRINVVNPFKDDSVVVCHKVATRGSIVYSLMTITLNDAITNHVAHGDALGNCSAFTGRTSAAEQEETPAQIPFASASDIHVYPNPSTGDFTVELPGGVMLDNADMMITDVQGKVVARRQLLKDGSSKAVFELGSVAKGMYLITVRCGDMLQRAKLVLR